MKAILLNDESADITTLPQAYRSKVKPYRKKGSAVVLWKYPKGTIFEGEHAVLLVKIGQASPLDDECREACGMTKEQIDTAQIGYVMDSLGIREKEHRDLYAGGVILGFLPNGDFIPGPNWAAYQAAIAEEEAEDNLDGGSETTGDSKEVSSQITK